MSRGGEQLKVSEVAGLIDQIETGGGATGFNFIEKVEINSTPLEKSSLFLKSTAGENYLNSTLKFTPKDNIDVFINFDSFVQADDRSYGDLITITPDIRQQYRTTLTKGTEYSIKFNAIKSGSGFIYFVDSNVRNTSTSDVFDVIIFYLVE